MSRWEEKLKLSQVGDLEPVFTLTLSGGCSTLLAPHEVGVVD